MQEIFKKLKNMTGCTYEKLGETAKCTKQYINLLIHNPSPNNNLRLANIMGKHIEQQIDQEVKVFHNRMNELNKLKREVLDSKHFDPTEST